MLKKITLGLVAALLFSQSAFSQIYITTPRHHHRHHYPPVVTAPSIVSVPYQNRKELRHDQRDLRHLDQQMRRLQYKYNIAKMNWSHAQRQLLNHPISPYWQARSIRYEQEMHSLEAQMANVQQQINLKQIEIQNDRAYITNNRPVIVTPAPRPIFIPFR